MLQNENEKESNHSKSVGNAGNGKWKKKKSDHSKSVGNATTGKWKRKWPFKISGQCYKWKMKKKVTIQNQKGNWWETGT